MNASLRAFGPFVQVPCEEVHPAGFDCGSCRKPVEVLRQSVPYLVPRFCIYSCPCGSICVFEDERQPTVHSWHHGVELLKTTGASLAIFNGEKPLSPDFAGLN